MCVVSMIGDEFTHHWKNYKDYLQPQNPMPNQLPRISRNEFNDLKKEVEILKQLLKAGKKYDEKNNEPNCEIEEKMDFLRKVAKLVDVDLDEVFKK